MALADELSALLAHDSRSILRRLDELTPYLTPASVPAWTRLRRLSHDADLRADRLTAILNGLGLHPSTANYPIETAGMHFLRIDALMPLIIDEKKRLIAAYDRALSAAAGNPAVLSQLKALADENRQALAELQSLAV